MNTNYLSSLLFWDMSTGIQYIKRLYISGIVLTCTGELKKARNGFLQTDSMHLGNNFALC